MNAYKITVKNADKYMIGYMVGSSKGLAGPQADGPDCVFVATQKEHDTITKFLNKFDMDGLRYTVEIL